VRTGVCACATEETRSEAIVKRAKLQKDMTISKLV
jgi:hypothetical protein